MKDFRYQSQGGTLLIVLKSLPTDKSLLLWPTLSAPLKSTWGSKGGWDIASTFKHSELKERKGMWVHSSFLYRLNPQKITVHMLHLMNMCLPGLEILAMSGIILTSWYFVTLTYPIAELATSCNFVLPGFYAEVRCSQRTAHPPVYNMLLQCYSHSKSLTIITNSNKHGYWEVGWEGEAVGFWWTQLASYLSLGFPTNRLIWLKVVYLEEDPRKHQ